MKLTPEQVAFRDKAVEDAKAYGGDTAVLLVASLAAGYGDGWSDIDMWMLGSKNQLRGNQRKEFDRTGAVFVDRGDLEAHYNFYDLRDIEERLNRWRDETLWLVQMAQIIHDPSGVAHDLRGRFKRYPPDVLERKLKWWYFKYSEGHGRIGVIGRGMPEAAVLLVSQCIESLCKTCLLAEGRPFPYKKWLFRAAEDTRLGRVVCPAMKRAIEGLPEALRISANTDWKELATVKEIRKLKTVLPEELKKTGWHGDWVENPGHYVWVLFSQQEP